MNDDIALKLYNKICNMEKDMQAGFENMATKDDINQLKNTIDGLVGRLETQELEQAAHIAEFNTLVAWAKKAAIKTNVPLKGL